MRLRFASVLFLAVLLFPLLTQCPVLPTLLSKTDVTSPLVKEVFAAGGSKTLGVTTIAHDYDPYLPIDPLKIVLGDGTVIYKTTYGNYSMDKANPYTFSYVERGKVKYVDRSMFWLILPKVTNVTYSYVDISKKTLWAWHWQIDYINPLLILDPNKIANVRYPATSSNGLWQIAYDVQYKNEGKSLGLGEFSKDTVVATLTVTWQFFKETLPKITITVDLKPEWSTAKLRTYSVVWSILPLSKNYVKTGNNTAVDYSTATTTTNIGCLGKVEFGSSSNLGSWTYPRLMFSWEDLKQTAVVAAGVEQVFGGKGITVLFPYNVSSIDPTFGFTSTGSTSYPTVENGQTSGDDIQTVPSYDYMASTKITLATPLTVSEIHVWPHANTNIKVAIYDDSGGEPNNLIVANNANQAATAHTWKAATITATYLAAGTYHIGIKSVYASSIHTNSAGALTLGNYVAHNYDVDFPATFGAAAAYYPFVLHVYGVQIKGYIKTTKVTLSETAPTVDSMSVYCHAASGNLRIALFDNAVPKAKVWESASTAAVAATWLTILISAGTPSSISNLAAGTYHLGWQYDNVGLVPSYTAGVAGDGFYLAQTYGAFPATITGETSSAEKWSIYVTYTTNTAPTNIAGTITDMDDGDNLYAQKKLYTGASSHIDLDGAADFDYVEFRILQGAAVRARFRYDEDTDTFTVEEGGANWVLDASSLAAPGAVTLAITWKFAAKGSATEESDIELELYCIDAAAASDTDTAQTNYCDVVTRLVTVNFASSKSYSQPSGAVTMTLDVRYGNDPGSNVASASYPPDAEFSAVKIHDSAHVVVATDNVIGNGAVSVTFNVPGVAGTYTYHVYVDMVDVEFTDQDAVDGDTVSVTVTSMSLSLSVSAIHGTYESRMNVTALFANGTGVSGTTFYAYGSSLLGSAVSSGSGLAQFTFTSVSLQGSGTLVFNGTKNGVTGSCSVSYSISVSGAAYSVCPSDWNMGQPQAVSISFTNGAVVNSTKVKLENVRLCFRLMSGSTVLFQTNSSTYDADANSVQSQSVTLTPTGVSTTGTYTLRCLIYQLGSESLLGTVDQSVYVQALGSIVNPPSQSPRLVVPILSNRIVMQGASDTFTFQVGILQTSSADFTVSAATGVSSSWVTVSGPNRISGLSAAEVQVSIYVPPNADPGSYQITIPISASTGSGSARESVEFTLIVKASSTSTVSPMAMINDILSNISFPVILVVVMVVGVVCVVAVAVNVKPKRKLSRRYYR